MAILNMCFGTKVNETLAKILSVLLSARLGESVGVHTDPYRIVTRAAPGHQPPADHGHLESDPLRERGSLIRLVIKTSSYLRWRFVYVAKKFGAVEKDADYRR